MVITQAQNGIQLLDKLQKVFNILSKRSEMSLGLEIRQQVRIFWIVRGREPILEPILEPFNAF